MNKKSKKKIRWGRIVGILIILLAIVMILFIKFLPYNKWPFLNNDNLFSQILCSYPVTVAGERMEPFISANSNVIFNKCFQTNDLQEGLIIIYRDDNTQRIGIIRYIQDYGRIIYKVSTELELQNLVDVEEDQILGIIEIDTSETKYIPVEEEKFTEISDYVSEIYLGTIPVNQGLENSVVKESNQFDLENDKFCFIIYPKKEIFNVDLEVYEKSSESIISSSDDIIFNEAREYIDCDTQFSNLPEGEYTFKVYIENILLKEINFEIL